MAKNKFLLDTHVFIWAMEGSRRLPEELKKRISNPSNKVFVSVATIWEIVIKKSSKKIKLSFNIEDSIKRAGLELLSIQAIHVLEIEKLPLIHKDPFDRMLIAQAKVENLVLITDDTKIKRYPVSVFH